MPSQSSDRAVRLDSHTVVIFDEAVLNLMQVLRNEFAHGHGTPQSRLLARFREDGIIELVLEPDEDDLHDLMQSKFDDASELQARIAAIREDPSRAVKARRRTTSRA